VAYLVEHNVGVNHEPVAILASELGMARVAALGKHGAVARELITESARSKTTWNVVTDVAFTKD
jgi:hypothetical protein